MDFNITYTEDKRTVDLFSAFDRNEKTVVLKGSGFKDIYHLYHAGKYKGLVVGTTMQAITDEVEKKIYK